ncbi:MAG: DedA family protein [Alphaproteobacteria bacterium]|nr:DedA family protein [Alphaproteobacteria bacterium]
MGLAARRDANWALAGVSFAESSFFPIPPDVMLIPMVLVQRAKAWFIATVCTVSSVLGGYAGYAIGFFLFEAVGRTVVEFYGQTEGFAEFQNYYKEWGAWIVAGAGFTPFPYKIVTIASGVVHMDLLTFGIASVLSRGARFFLVAGLLYWLGPPIRVFIERNLGLLTFVFFALLLGGFVAVRYLF